MNFQKKQGCSSGSVFHNAIVKNSNKNGCRLVSLRLSSIVAGKRFEFTELTG